MALRFDSMDSRSLGDSDKWHARYHLGKVLTAAGKLQHLTISGSDFIYPPGSASEYSWLSSIIRDEDHAIRRKPLFPRLRDLTLEAVGCQE